MRFAEVDTKNAAAVEREVLAICLGLFPEGNPLFVTSAFQWAADCFEGRYADYQPIDALYHDFEHTLQGTLCLMRLLEGYAKSSTEPPINCRQWQLSLLAILFHDTGYLKRADDTSGTGAKYTLTHVKRSSEFAETFFRNKGFETAEIATIQNMILCTGVNAKLDSIPFQNEFERTLGSALATCDLLGQMAAADYIQKLPVLYKEFEESAGFNEGKMSTGALFKTAEDLVQKTPGFWEYYVKNKIEKDFQGLHNFLRRPYPAGRNHYIERIEANISTLRSALGT